MRILLRNFMLAAVVAASLAASTAVAAPAKWESVHVTLHTEDGKGMLLIAGELPASTKLPAEASLSVPPGSKIEWFGEILGGPPANDPEVKYTRTAGKGADDYSFVLRQARTAQAEIPSTSGLLFDGTNYRPSISWTAGSDVPNVQLTVRIPDGATITEPAEGASTQPGEEGFSFYTKSFRDVKAGDKLELALAYAPPAAGTTTAATQPAGDSSGMIVVGIIVLVIGGAALLAFRKKTAPLDEIVADEGDETGAPEQTESTTVESASDEDAALPATPSGAASRKRLFVVVAVVGALVALTVVVTGQGAKPKAIGGVVTETFAQGEPCVTSTLALSLPADTDPASAAESLLAPLRTATGLKSATFDASKGTLQVGYCESETTEDALRTLLAPTGLLAAGGGAPAAQPQ
ncbi:MAG: hypothetical protein HGB10_08440 [Coriobacteriia bacterium]|nr:hypothetical protein [Coriobacteriia bacterium]